MPLGSTRPTRQKVTNGRNCQDGNCPEYLKQGLHSAAYSWQTSRLFMVLSQRPRFAAPGPTMRVDPPARKSIFLIHNSGRLGSPMKAALLERGYQVIHAESVEAALQIWAKLAVPV